jgi:NAD(P)H-hydrate epimerase
VKLVTARQMQEIDRHTIDTGLVPALELMENAGAAATSEALRLLGPLAPARVEILCGKGNNGGDGLVVARLLAARGHRVHVSLTHPSHALSPDARANHRRLRGTGVRTSVLPDVIDDPGTLPDPSLRHGGLGEAWRQRLDGFSPSTRDLARALSRADLCIDALLGTGAERDLAPRYAALVNLLNHCSRRTLAVDVPSGVDATDGRVLGTAVWADATVTFGLPKLGLALYPGRERAGELGLSPIGFPPHVLDAVRSDWTWVGHDLARYLIPRLEPTAHKYSRGTLLVVAGSRSYPGAAALTSEAAYRAGAGMVHLVAPESIRPILETQLPEVIVHGCAETPAGCCDATVLDIASQWLPRCDALAIGPGIAGDESVREWIEKLLDLAACPAVIDADAVLALPAPPHRAPRITTPHAGELARWLQTDPSRAVEARVEQALEAARRSGSCVVAKGAPTVTVTPDGARRVNGSGHAGLATAGSGDVLTGVIGSLLAQGLVASDAASLGVFLHGLAAEEATRLTSPRSLLSRDLLGSLGKAYATLEKPFGRHREFA